MRDASDDGVNEWTSRLSDEEIVGMIRDANLVDPELSVTGARQKLITHYLRKCIMLKSVDREWARERLMPGAIEWADEIVSVINICKREQLIRGLDNARQPRDE